MTSASIAPRPVDDVLAVLAQRLRWARDAYQERRQASPEEHVPCGFVARLAEAQAAYEAVASLARR